MFYPKTNFVKLLYDFFKMTFAAWSSKTDIDYTFRNLYGRSVVIFCRFKEEFDEIENVSVESKDKDNNKRKTEEETDLDPAEAFQVKLFAR